MPFTRPSNADQFNDIQGTTTPNDQLNVEDAALSLGQPIQSGSFATIFGKSSDILTINNLSGITMDSLENYLSLSGSIFSQNNGTFLIVNINSSTSVDIENPNSVFPDSSPFLWIEREPYTLQTDENYNRSDHRNIKGTSHWYDPVPMYDRPDASSTQIPANLFNIAGKTTDARGFITRKISYDISVETGNISTLFVSIGNLKHSDSIDKTGVPTFDAGPYLNLQNSCYVQITDGYFNEIVVKNGDHSGERIFGITYNGSSSSPDSVEIHFFSVPYGQDIIGNSTIYSWETGQPNVNFNYGYFQRLDLIPDDELNILLNKGLASASQDNNLKIDIENLYDAIGIPDGYSSLSGVLTNLTDNFIFSDLPSQTPSIVDVLNTINEQVGDRNYTGDILTSGQTITESLQALSDNEGTGGEGLTPEQHETLRQLIHLANGVGGPFEGFASGAYREVVRGDSFAPTLITWYSDSTKTRKIVDKTVNYTNFFLPATIQWQSYGTDGYTVLSIVSDTITYNNVFEQFRIRDILDSSPTDSSFINPDTHKILRQLIHLADGVGGPFEGFTSGAYRETLYFPNQPFIQSVIWYNDSTKTRKIVEHTIDRNNINMPTTITWKVYDVDGSTVLSTAVDTIAYTNNIFESNRVRSI